MIRVTSSNVDSVGYDESAAELHVAFKNGSDYVYEGVPVSVFELLLQAPSKGRFLNQEVKTRYRHRKVGL